MIWVKLLRLLRTTHLRTQRWRTDSQNEWSCIICCWSVHHCLVNHLMLHMSPEDPTVKNRLTEWVVLHHLLVPANFVKDNADTDKSMFRRDRSNMILKPSMHLAQMRQFTWNTNVGYPCGICSDPVTWEQDAICCDLCSTWNHKVCFKMLTTLFTKLANTVTIDQL